MKEKLEQLLGPAISSLRLSAEEITVSYPKEEGRGDYMTSAPLVIAKTVGKNPKEVSKQITEEISEQKPDYLDKVETAGPGFINFYLSRSYFSGILNEVLKNGEKFGKGTALSGKKIMIEHTQPNPFKEFHIGHLMNNAIGESIARMVKSIVEKG